jgi:hypothetical protein
LFLLSILKKKLKVESSNHLKTGRNRKAKGVGKLLNTK